MASKNIKENNFINRHVVEDESCPICTLSSPENIIMYDSTAIDTVVLFDGNRFTSFFRRMHYERRLDLISHIPHMRIKALSEGMVYSGKWKRYEITEHAGKCGHHHYHSVGIKA